MNFYVKVKDAEGNECVQPVSLNVTGSLCSTFVKGLVWVVNTSSGIENPNAPCPACNQGYSINGDGNVLSYSVTAVLGGSGSYAYSTIRFEGTVTNTSDLDCIITVTTNFNDVGNDGTMHWYFGFDSHQADNNASGTWITSFVLAAHTSTNLNLYCYAQALSGSFVSSGTITLSA